MDEAEQRKYFILFAKARARHMSIGKGDFSIRPYNRLLWFSEKARDKTILTSLLATLFLEQHTSPWI
jgi:hypothetical protein